MKSILLTIAILLAGCSDPRWNTRAICRHELLYYFDELRGDPSADDFWARVRFAGGPEGYVANCARDLGDAVDSCKDYRFASDLGKECYRKEIVPAVGYWSRNQPMH
jgi:hypothetical protein